jgi:hypothetical protein
MKYEEVSVNYLFRNSQNIYNQNARIESSEKIAELKKTISKEKSQLEWADVSGKIIKKSSELLDIRLKDILESAWVKYSQVEQCIEQAKENPEETYLVPLLNHMVVSDHHPQIEIRIDEVLFGKVNFEILLKLELKGIILKIKRGKIDGVKVGSCQCKGSLACEGIVLFEDNSETYDF